MSAPISGDRASEDVTALLCRGKPLSDEQQVLLLMYIIRKGLPSWAKDISEEGLCARLFAWPLDRSKKAFEECRAKGWMEQR